MAERRDAFLSFPFLYPYLTLILVCNVLASIGQIVASAESSHHRGRRCSGTGSTCNTQIHLAGDLGEKSKKPEEG